jgi:hydrogenase maturation protein HypF
MAEHNVEEIIGICCDGYGYGLDGEAWGGEVLFCTRESPVFERVGHLQRQPLVGGDLATRFPLRMAAGILHGHVDVDEWLMQHRDVFPHGEVEVKVILDQLEGKRSIIGTTSCGRILDAAAAILGVCYERTYEGEPAMKLESQAVWGRDVLRLEPEFHGDVLNTTRLILEIFENKDKIPKENLALSAHLYLARGLAALAVEKAQEIDVKAIGFSGGVAYNEIMASEIRRVVEAAGLRFFVNEAVPPGDGGLSFGQAVVAGFHHP